jgi:hypothetical protein
MCTGVPVAQAGCNGDLIVGMKAKQKWLAVWIGIVLLATGLVAFRPFPESAQSVLVSFQTQTNSSQMTSNRVTLVVTNSGPRAILLTDLILETKTSEGWRAVSHSVPTDPQRLAVGDVKDLGFGFPDDPGLWRLRVTFGRDVYGPILWLAKAEYVVSHRRLTAPGVGVMAGSYETYSAEILR